jgi:DNA-directed RNA polymerase specialized sigma24 family protein
VSDGSNHDGLLYYIVGQAIRAGTPGCWGDLAADARLVLLEAERQHKEDEYKGKFSSFLATRLRWHFANKARSGRRAEAAISSCPPPRSPFPSSHGYQTLCEQLSSKLSDKDASVFSAYAEACLYGDAPTQAEVARALGRSVSSVCRSMGRIREVVGKSCM